jgi:hypothetical protein
MTGKVVSAACSTGVEEWQLRRRSARNLAIQEVRGLFDQYVERTRRWIFSIMLPGSTVSTLAITILRLAIFCGAR